MPLPLTTDRRRTGAARALIDRLSAEGRLPVDDLETLIRTATDADRAYAREAAVAVAHENFGNRVFVRGLIEFSNHCRQDCFYCGIRKSNRETERYRLDAEQILACCAAGHALGYRTFVLQSGEDSRYTTEVLVDIIGRIRATYPDCAITLSVGERGRSAYQAFFDAGANRFLLRHETATADHYARLHPAGQTLATRMECLRTLKDIGFQTGAGFMVGSPFQTVGDLARDLAFLAELRPHMVGMGPFLPQHSTPFRDEQAGDVDLTLFLLSLVRLMLPTVLLPSTTALGTARSGGREAGILAGANVIMLNLSPTDLRPKYLLYDNKPVSGDIAEMTQAARASLGALGYEIVVDRGDHPEVAR
ncbi:[FeFe] hydrogenase H-cluster radical SAM maturase HydE [Actinotalea fermentans]|uniref:[FeFe] hydrogenase H-cluster radical SAM maturase HydE n=1 Tax=Actinotalea fermentans TaxID=43671 RepID=A0A511YUT5_9CELL|nr:[FeFe] hydrogenase H-cluster radical SAM maturase HydE [Actinotalea fermentans]KGM17952.1 biotin synthase [Actinotalea fermentans ATCC 43279 = JCM 9966 = DSM 3133]GEN78951.1 [FeFe] hydrogenase H-cluster radical SAM maturase HydE [Actinotalea fermentans]